MTWKGARATNSPDGASRSSTLIRGPCWRKSWKSRGESGSPPKPELGSEGASPPKPTRIAWGPPVSRPYERMKNTRSSSGGVKLQGSLRSFSVTGNGRRERQSAFPLALPLRYSRVYLYAVRNSNHRCTRGLCSAILSRCSSALWSEKMRKVVPHK